jgi:hypothetical protein
VVLCSVLDDGELQAEADLRRGKTDARRKAKSLKHVGNGLLKFGSADFLWTEGSCELPENRLSSLHNFEFQRGDPSAKC